LNELSKNEKGMLESYFSRDREHILFRDDGPEIRMIDAQHWEAVNYMKMKLPRIAVGLPIGELKKKDFVPSHSLAMAVGIDLNFPSLELDLRQALTLLKKENLDIDFDKNSWLLAKYKGLNLAWLKKVPGRINNYLPKSNRIRMNIDLSDY
jgi:NOL1/NOP2/fmu family ribosome biogenesis protein